VRSKVDRPAIEEPCTRNSTGSAAPAACALARRRYIASFTVPLRAQYSPLNSETSAASASADVAEIALGTNAAAPSAAAK